MTVTGVRVLGDRYELGEIVGTGGMADVYRATDRVLTRTVAIKMLRSTSADQGERDRFATEARTLAVLNHPGLVMLLDAGIRDEHPYLVMELVDGPSLSRAIKESGPLDPVRVASLGAQIAEALAYAHQRGVVHRDVKPGNILVTADDRALLADFGIAKLLAETSHHTKTGETIGSPAYLSPEQVNGEPLTEAVDVYSLGLVLLEALTGQRAYPGTPVEAAIARLSAAPAIPTSLDAGWRDLLEWMTKRDPADRPSAGEVAAALSSTVHSAPQRAATSDAEVPTGAFDLAAATGAQAAGPVDTGSLEIPAAAEQTVVGHPVDGASPRRRLPLLGAAAVLVVALALLGTFALLQPGASPEPVVSEVPASIPDRMQQPLQDLHDAVEGGLR